MFSRGEVWLVQLPLGSTTEPEDQLPAVILQKPEFSGSLPGVLAAPMTRSTEVLRLPGTVEIAPTAENELEEGWTALVFEMRSIDRSRLVRRLGVLDSQDLDRILMELDDLTGR